MEKLIKLLNDYERNVLMESYMHPVYYYDECNNKILNLYVGFNTEDEVKYQWLLSYIVSKHYGFIKWLVENDKIELKAGPLYGFQPIMNNRQPFTLYESLLMLLAIQDNSIEFLISILK